MTDGPHRRRAVRVRARAPVVVQTRRDLDILTVVGLARYVTTEQIARDFFPSADRARHRVRALFDAGLVTVMVIDSARPNLVALTRRGLSAVLAEAPGLDGRVGLAGAVRLPAIAHHVAVVDARLFAAGLAAREGVPLRFEGGAGALAAELGLPALRLEPDGVVAFGSGATRATVAVEIDLGSEGLKVLGAKFERYAAAFGSSALDVLWLVVKAGDGRLASLRAAVAASRIAERTTVIPHGHLLVRPAAGLPPSGGPTGRPDGRGVGRKEQRQCLTAAHP